MKYYSYYEPKDPGNGDFSAITVTLSEQEILKEYWDYWYGRMCDKFGKERVDAECSPADCIDDWIVIHWAWESDNADCSC